MGSRSKRLQIYGVGVPWGQRPHSTPGGEAVQLDISPSKWAGEAAANQITFVASGQISRAITTSCWTGAASINPLLAGGINTIVRPATPSAWLADALPNAIDAQMPVDVSVAMTPSAWLGAASPSRIVAADISCCDRIYEPVLSCRKYEPICCVGD